MFATQVFEGKAAGTIVPPRGLLPSGDKSAGAPKASGEPGVADDAWHTIFVPEGAEATLAEMGKDQRDTFLPRTSAVRALEVG